jgi:hypothetical protein
MSRGHTHQNENETSEVSETSEVLTVYMGEELMGSFETQCPMNP